MTWRDDVPSAVERLLGDGVKLNDITITGAAAAGVLLDGASNFVLDRVTVRDSRADGIHLTRGSNHGDRKRGPVSNIVFRNIAIQQQPQKPPVLFANAPRETYTLSGITLNGPPYTAPENQSGSTAAKVPGKAGVNLPLMAISFPGMALIQQERIRKAKDWERPACDRSREDCT
jgi:hypothetical protein